ncbi:pyroglutamyl-peptidase I [Microbacterium sp. NPDC077184]|uniref:pyroglutamyl-peptidase I n=1 Tax=Microbacterium sp. NPDC077184 TaxID=3154764 RepID=UPI003434CE88
MTRALVTGFVPFAGDAANPSGDAVRLLAASWSGPAELVTAILPVSFGGAAAALRSLIDEQRPDVVIATGLAGDRDTITPERIAVNLADARIPDNDGAQPIDAASVPGAPAAFFATLPVKAIVADLRAAGVPASVSHSAGTFVCNHVMFHALHATAGVAGARAGFVHVPWTTDHRADAVVSTADVAHALALALETTLRAPVDPPLVGGALS